MSWQYLGCSNCSVQYYGRSEPSLNDVSLSISQGESVLFLGSSGCGKSTLLNVLAGIIPRSIDAHVKGDVSRPDRVGSLFQDPEAQFCMLHLDDEIAFSLENKQVPSEAMPQIIRRVKQRVGLAHFDAKTPIHSLSGGMKQRLALATVLALEPEVIFLDEPTAQLDPKGTQRILDIVQQLKQEHTLVLIEHKLDGLMDWVDRVVLFSPQGNIIDDDSPRAIFQNHSQRIQDYGIWKPKLWPLSWEAIITDEDNEERLNDWKPKQLLQPSEQNLLDVSEASLILGKKSPIWSDVNVTIRKGDWVSVLGPNGSGKSSFLKTLMGIHPLSKGNIQYTFLDSYKSYSPERLSEHIGFVFQNPEHQFITDTVYDEIAFMGKIESWPQDEIISKVEKLLQDFQLFTWKDVNPFTLSIGQKRRLSVASMLLKEHKLLVLDEPTFGQDAATAGELMNYLTDLHQRGTTIIMATHDVELAYRYSTKVLVFADGQLIYSGTPQELFTNPALLERAQLMEPMHIEFLRRKSALAQKVALS